VDEGTALADLDGDGYRVLDGDCADDDPRTYPGAVDRPDDGIDNDCGDAVSDRAPVASAALAGAAAGCASVTLSAAESIDPDGGLLIFQWYRIDGPAQPTFSTATSSRPDFSWAVEGLYRVGLAVSDGTLTGQEVILELDTAALRRYCTVDRDGDGFSPSSGDCDDDAPGIHPAALEVCDGIDQNCDGLEVLFDDDFEALNLERWQLFGDAFAEDGRVILADAVPDQTGSLFLTVPLELDHFTVRFEILIDGGFVGEGMTFAVIDADSDRFLGGATGGLGLAGLDGWGIEFDTAISSVYGDPNYHHVALVQAAGMTAATTYRATVRASVMVVEVRYDAGTVTVLKNDLELFTKTPEWDMPLEGFLGFTASTGSRTTDRHEVQRVSFECR